MMGFSEGDRMEISGVITGVRSFGSDRRYSINDGNAAFSFRSREVFAIGDVVALDGVFESLADFTIAPRKVAVLAGKDADAACAEVERRLAEKAALKRGFISENPANSALAKTIESVARKLIAARELNRFVMLRFHGDADGIAGALALRSVLRFRAYQQNSAVYSPREAVNDIGNLHHENRPLLILLDFGTNAESIDGLKLLRAAGIETMAIDHHPLHAGVKQLVGMLLSPWLVEGLEEPSKYSAGYLAAEIANMCGAENAAAYAGIACAGDKSDIMRSGETEKKAALVLDYLAAHASFGNSLDFYGDVLKNEELFDSLWQQASEKINEALGAVLPRVKKSEKNGIIIYAVPLDGVVTKGEFPNRSKVTTAIFEKFATDSPMITLGYGKGTVIARCNSAFVAKGAGLSDIIKKVSSDMKDFVAAGGGHAKAAAMKVQEGYEKSVVERLIGEL